MNHEAPTTRRPAPWIALAAAVFAVAWRVLPHPFNVTPVGGLGLFGGARLRLWQAILLPVAVMAVSDVVLYSIFGYPPSPVVYLCLPLYAVIGRLVAGRGGIGWTAAASLLGSVLFFLVTNFAIWLDDGTLHGQPALYAPTLQGLLACYVAALPFFGNTLAGDLGTTAVLFGAYAWLTRTAAEQPASTESLS